MHTADVEEVDAYLLRDKTMRGYLPGWTDLYRRQWQARWGIECDGIENSELCLTTSRDWRHQTIACMLRQRLIYRLDIAPISECKLNHHTAWKQGLPHEVCGPHVHGWPENRHHVINNGFSDMPVRRLIDGLVETLSDALGWVAKDLNIHIAPDQRDFAMPAAELI